MLAGHASSSWHPALFAGAPYNRDTSRVHNKLHFMNLPKGSLMEDVYNIISVFSQVAYRKLVFLACLIIEIAMKKTL